MTENKKTSLLQKPVSQMNTYFPYLLVFFIPVLILDGFTSFYASGYGQIVPGSLNYLLNFWNGLASVCFYFLLKHQHRFDKLSECFRILLSVSYGLCAYALVQETNIRYLTVFALFPLFFYAYEKMLYEDRKLVYILLLTAFILLDYMLGAIILLTMTVHVLLFSKEGIGSRLRVLLKYWGYSALSLLMSGIVSFPHFADYFANLKLYPYTGFETTMPVITALSRFLLGSVSSAAFFSGTKLDLYFGLFPLLSAILYFILPGGAKEKLKRFLFLFFLLSAVEFSPVYFIMNFFRMYSGSSVYYSFLLIFFLLLTASDALTKEQFFKPVHLTVLTVCGSVYLVVCIACAGHNYHSTAVYSNVFFFLSYILLLFIISFRKKNQFPAKPLLVCLIALELFCNIFIVTNQNFINVPLELSDRIPDISALQTYPAMNPDSASEPEADNTESEEAVSFTATEIESSSETIRSEQYIATDLMQLLNTLPSDDILTEADRQEAGITALSDYADVQNAICRKLGSTEDLFLPAEFELTFEPSDFYQVVHLGNHIYSFEYLHNSKYSSTDFYDMDASIQATHPGTLIILDTLDMQLYRFSVTDDSLSQQVSFYLPLSSEYAVNNRLNGYWLNEELAARLPELIADYTDSVAEANTAGPQFSAYLGITATCIGVFLMLLLFFNRDKDKIFASLTSAGNKIENSRILDKLGKSITANRIYWLSFLIPLCYFLFCLIVNSCTPFGNNSIFDEDGLYLTYPSNLDIYYNLKNGHALYSFLGGYGYNMYAVNPLAITRIFTLLFSPDQIPALLTLEEGLYLGLSGLALAFYLTHRLTGTRADKHDFRILAAVMIYTLNNYMLCMHGFTSWYQIFPALPLLFLAMDYLMEKKKWLSYTLILTFCIYANLYLALYICIFLVIRFFTYRFADIRDFIQRGLRFAGCSVLAAANSFFIITNTLLASADSAYQIDDSNFPAPGFHGNFFSQWKQHMIFSEVGAVNWNENYVNLYFGIGTLLLILVFCMSRKIKLSDKLRFLIPMAILYLSFNGKLLSFIWNGFHYQTGVPNRYAFLLMITVAVLAYDSLCVISELSPGRYICIAGSTLLLFVLFQYIGSANSTYAFLASLVVVVIYLISLLYPVIKRNSIAFCRIFSVLLALELLVNMLFSFRQYNLNGIYKVGDLNSIHDALAEADSDDPAMSRTIYAAAPFKNAGFFYETESNEIFNSFVTMHQSNLNMRYGMTGGVNFLTTSNASIPLAVSLSGTRFIYCAYITENICEDLAEYRYLGNVDDCYVFENPYTLPLGIYTPVEAASLDNYSSFVPYYLEDLSSFYLSDGTSLFKHQRVSFRENAEGSNIFYYTDENDRILTFAEVEEILAKENADGNSTEPTDNLYINISVTPEEDGPIYLYAIEFVCLGYAEKGETLNSRIRFPASNIPASNDYYNLTVFQSEHMPEFYENASENTLQDIKYEGNTLSGTTDYESDGYTMLSIPYERGWKAYIDGEEVEIEDPYQSMMFVKTPAGHHELKLVFTPYGMVPSLFVTGGSIIFTALLFLISSRTRRKHPNSITK